MLAGEAMSHTIDWNAIRLFVKSSLLFHNMSVMTYSKFRGNINPVNCSILLLVHRNKRIQLAKLDGGPLRVIYARVPVGNPSDAAISRGSLH